jgi:hypothetical protein
MRARRWTALVAVAVAVSSLIASPSGATSFSYQVDRFELDGNPRGPMDGTLDWIDEFPGGSLGTNWYRAYGTVTEHDNALFLTDPGTAFPNPDGQLTDLSIAANAYPYIQDGHGSFVATAFWVPLLPPAGHHYHFSIYTFGSVQFFNEIVGLGFLGLGDGQYAIEQHVTEINLGQGIYHNLVSVQHPIDPALLANHLVMRIAFDDATNAVTTSFSLDGGTTWESPFAPATIFNGRTSAQFILSADPLDDGTPVPTTTVTTTSTSTSTSTTLFPPGPCDATGCRRGVVPLKSVLRMKSSGVAPYTVKSFAWKWNKGAATEASDFGNPQGGTSYELCIADASGTLSTFVFPHDRWLQTGGAGFRYNNVPHGGFNRMTLRAGTDGRAAVSVSGSTSLGLALPLAKPVTVRLRNTDGQCWANVFDADVTLDSPKAFKGFE